MLQVMYEARRGDEVAYLYFIPGGNYPPFDLTFIPDEEDDIASTLSIELQFALSRFLRNYRAPGGLPEYITGSNAFVREFDKSLGITFKKVYESKPNETGPGIYF